MENPNQIYCVKLVFQAPDDVEPTIILGRLLEQDDDFVVVKSGRGRVYRVSRHLILNYETTDILFREGA